MSVFQRRKSILTFIQEKGKRAIRQIGESTGISKSAAGRQMVSQKKRLQYSESLLWETPEGFKFLDTVHSSLPSCGHFQDNFFLGRPMSFSEVGLI